MVEGPGCKLKGEKIRSKVLNQSLEAVSGNAVDRQQKILRNQKKDRDDKKSGATSAGDAGSTSFHRLLGHKLDEVLTLGKELFMFFGESCLRVHFLMAGSFRVNDVKVDTDGGKTLPASASLEMHLSKDKLTFYKCAAEIRPSSACRHKYRNLKDLDICSATFNPKQAVREMMMENDRQLCDVLLDQGVLPGVGNIIKNEALFDSGLKPDSKVSELSEEHISHLVKMTRDFSMVFYKCRKNGTNLRQYMKVYQKGMCGECGTKIVMTRMGEDSKRVTFFCPACQTNHLKRQGPLKLPSKNSLLGWVQTDRSSCCAKEEWTCQKCTLFNPANQSNCSACLSPRSSQSGPACTAASPSSSVTFTTGPAKRKLQDDSPGSTSSQQKKIKPDAGKGFSQSQERRSAGCVPQERRSAGCVPQERRSAGCVPQERRSAGCVPQERRSAGCVPAGDPSSAGGKIPACPGHGAACAMRQTFKDNGNKGRWFFACAVAPASKRCKFFQWADEQFPECSGHGQACALRTVMKQGPNNGRRFFCCPVRKNGCQFFEWASGYG